MPVRKIERKTDIKISEKVFVVLYEIDGITVPRLFTDDIKMKKFIEELRKFHRGFQIFEETLNRM